jgi:hypothetical protein
VNGHELYLVSSLQYASELRLRVLRFDQLIQINNKIALMLETFTFERARQIKEFFDIGERLYSRWPKVRRPGNPVSSRLAAVDG